MPIWRVSAANNTEMAKKPVMKVLVTGAGGFVGPYLLAALRERFGPEIEILATGKHEDGKTGTEMRRLDITEPDAVAEIIRAFSPTHLFHLAGIAAPMAAGANPEAAWKVNVAGTLNIARAVMDHAPECTLFSVGSGLVYGESANAGVALDEKTLLVPLEDYSVTKAAADLALGALAKRGLKCVRLRPFNHTGRGQEEAYVVPAFAMQIARIEAGKQPPQISVGNLEAERDFLDVRDVVRAYVKAAEHAGELEPGCIINVASGQARRIGDILDALLSLSETRIEIVQDPKRMRPSDIPRYVGNADFAMNVLGWRPEHEFSETIADVLDDCRRRTGGGS